MMDSETRPRLKIKPALFDVLLECLGWLALCFIWILTVYNYPQLPEQIPDHFGSKGHADHYGAKVNLIALPIIPTILLIGLTLLSRFPHRFNYPIPITASNAAIQYKTATRLLRYLKFAVALVFLLLAFQCIQLATHKTALSPGLLLPLILGVILIPIGYAVVSMFRSK